MGLVVETLGIQVIIARNIIIHSLCIRFVISMLGTSSDWTTLMLVVLLLRFPKNQFLQFFILFPKDSILHMFLFVSTAFGCYWLEKGRKEKGFICQQILKPPLVVLKFALAPSTSWCI